MNAPHVSVLLEESIAALQPKDGGMYVDGTFGAGGHTEAILKAAKCTVIAIDRDPNVQAHVARLKEVYGDRLVFLEGKFGDMQHLLAQAGIEGVDGILLDIGVSSMQLDEGDRGFSFSHDGPLDMRMSAQGETAADVVNSMPEAALADLIYTLGDERKSRRIARAIAQARQEAPIETTAQLAAIIKQAAGKYNDNIHPATRSFQAIRMYVNDELGELSRALEAAEHVLHEGGRLAVITFHSGEDGLVKRVFNIKAGRVSNVSRHVIAMPERLEAAAFVLTPRKAIEPSAEEVRTNPRSRSARLRVIERVATGQITGENQ